MPTAAATSLTGQVLWLSNTLASKTTASSIHRVGVLPVTARTVLVRWLG